MHRKGNFLNEWEKYTLNVVVEKCNYLHLVTILTNKVLRGSNNIPEQLPLFQPDRWLKINFHSLVNAY